MRLTVFSDYSLRVLIYLGLQPGRLSTISEMAAAYGISRNHLMKVVHHLASKGYVETVRGKGGGLRLRMAPGAIRIGTVVRGTEEDQSLVECFNPETSNCRIESACALQVVLQQALLSFFDVLDQYTLADLLKPRARLAPLLLGQNLSPPQ